jgi:hypothetical protein
MGIKVPVLGFKETVGNFKGAVGNFKGTFESLWARRRPTEYVDPDSEPPTEWKEAVRPSGSVVSRLDSTGIEVLEDMGTTEQIEVATEPTGVATVVETHFRIRCECGRRWWALDLNPTTCPRCDRIVAIQSTD